MLYKDIECADVSDLIEQGPITIFDMRDLNSFNNDHMTNSVPANDFAIEQIFKNKKKQENILVYCYLGNSSRDLSNFLSKLGCKNVYNLIGGYTAWKKYNLSQNTQDVIDPVSTWLILKGFDPSNLKDRIANANTPLMEAAIEGNLAMINALLQRGADADLVNDDENIALWFSCFSNQVEAVKALLPSTSNINHQNVNGATCLSYAASSGKFEIVKTLVEAGADANIETHDGFCATELSSTVAILKYLRNIFMSNTVAT